MEFRGFNLTDNLRFTPTPILEKFEYSIFI